jgi:hypothetical protein
VVDLAGSERVGKSEAQGKQLNEALHINQSLHFLEVREPLESPCSRCTSWR